MTAPQAAAARPLTRRPIAHWFLLVLLLLALAAALAADGYAHRSLGDASTASAAGAPARLRSGAVLSYGAGGWRSLDPPRRTIALTFDDGPDPRWTPRILDVLRRAHVPATFFVVGTHVVDHPDLVRRELDDGHAVGSHTFTHADLSQVPGWRLNLELRLTQVALTHATGRHTALFRPPYSSGPDAVTQPQLRAMRTVAEAGYLIVLADRDAEDWRRPGMARIVANATPRGDAGAIIMFHDGGGNRGETVRALERLIPVLRARGDRFVTVPQLARVARNVAMPTVDAGERFFSDSLVVGLHAAHAVTVAITFGALALLVLTLLRAVLLATLAARHAAQKPTTGLVYAPSVSIIVPAYNEEAGIAATIRSLVLSRGVELEIVVVDDGSTDGTAAVVDALRDSRVTVIRQANTGKSGALNAGIASSSGEIVVTIDADTVVEPEAIARLVYPFWQRRVGATSGNTKVVNRTGLVGRWQHIEYVMGLNLDRRMFHMLGCIPTVPGAIGGFRRAALGAVGGFSDDTLAEDADATMAIHRAGFEVDYVDDAVAWTEAPSTLGDLWRQRYRWSYGTIQSIAKHRRAPLEHAGRRLGLVGLPYLLVFQVLLSLLAPIVDVFFVYGLVFLDPVPILAYWIGFNVVQMALAAYALALDHESPREVWIVALQQLVYRQLMYLVVIQSVISALLGHRLRWHRVRRTGTISELPAPTTSS